MSHTPILVFCLGSRPLSPLGGGNVAALQHEGRVGLMRPGMSLRSERRCSRQSPPVLQGLRSGRVRRVPGGLDRQRDSLHCPRSAEAAGRWHGIFGWHKPRRWWLGSLARGAGARGGRGERPSRDSRAPGGRARDQGGDPAPQARAERARSDPRETRGSPPARS